MRWTPSTSISWRNRDESDDSSADLRHEIDVDGVQRIRQPAVSVRGTIVGFISITPPGEAGYSIDKYFARDQVALPFDRGLYEVRLLTVTRPHRGAQLALLLMYGALRYLDSAGARTVVAIGRLDLLDMYKRAGLT